ncbi:endonuclease/exonuclease/phosphatase family protein [Dinghuibacter silviterrae]|uniref:Endonuclease/exonuclease/phosphatase family metal-dependent hydrolase n=1 Tax=Dinghuibacter silviterrae TaxID=1539049 RepID=A0A4R8DP02_9BACT|nr:endonuclease/exonuclease/phosphatase family protein [Dinghuibacter silviterrae]TDW99548.1 endonuclease/exonuclease/phosphatase family metal-dependent hydrolase [Dinghuibacter silviterrae]
MRALLILANSLVVILLLLVGLIPHVDPRHWWPLGFLALGFPWLLLLTLLFLLFWLIRRRYRWTLISLVGIILSLGPIRAFMSFHIDTHAGDPKPANMLKVMSWNVHLFNFFDNKKNPTVKQDMIELIHKEDPDIACFQEFFFCDTLAHPYSIQSFRHALGFPYYAVAYEWYADSRYNNTIYHYGVIIFSKYPILQQTNIIGKERKYNDVFEYADIVTPLDTFRVFNVHLQSLHFDKRDYAFLDNPSLSEGDSAKRQSRNILGKIKSGLLRRADQADVVHEVIEHSPNPVIVCGDFNDVPNSYAYATIHDGLKDAFREKGSGWSRTFSQISPTLRIDYILFDPSYNAFQYSCTPRVLSDHFPITATIYDPGNENPEEDHLPVK